MQLENRKPKVLYVDDEEDNLLVFKSSFRRFYDIYTAGSAAEGEEFLKETPVDVVISDQRMPSVSGVEFFKNLPDEPRNIRMIITGYSDIEAVIEALNLGTVHNYIKKPWSKDELREILDKSIEKLAKLRNEPGPSSEGMQAQAFEASTSAIAGEEGFRKILSDQDENIRQLQKQVREVYHNVQLLGEIGQEITSTLDLEKILNAVYENVNRLMDASVFGIGIYNSDNKTIEYRLAIENGKRYQPYTRDMEERDQFPVWCIENKREIFINDVYKEYSKYISQFKDKEFKPELEDGTKVDDPVSLIYMPLMVKDKVIGLVTIQSFKRDAYTQFHLDSLRHIAIFVATALENAKAYTMIEEQKSEIQQKNIELEHKVTQRTEELRRQKDELEDTFTKLKLLTEVGQEITSTLHLDTILNTIYENVNRLMDASVFGIGIFNADTETIDYRLAIENGKRYQPYTRTMEDKNQFPVWSIENRREIFINDVYKEYMRYISVFKDKDEVGMLEDSSQASEPLSFIYIPLLFNNNPIGVLTVQSFRKYAYNQYHLDILRSLASYITTAIQNAGSYSRMTEAFEQLKSAQTKLVESEKMASLGVLTAGVAHEINNPVNFISGGIESLKDNYDDIKGLLKLLSDYDPAKPLEEQWEKIDECMRQCDLSNLVPEMDSIINSIRNGATRTAEIVKGLRNFSRLDESDMKKAGMEEGIDNTLVILNNRIKGRITVTKDYGNVPAMMCYPGQLNQVFMNILYNAADAIDGTGEIHIKTREEDGKIKISIKDTGSGMPEHVRQHIFEPFFTTKPVGKGTGLGLSISYGIIEKHKGEIAVESQPGKGTEFIITLPL
jgi:signal transduction histidine kinase/YesN/AraC family two-component response regulator